MPTLSEFHNHNHGEISPFSLSSKTETQLVRSDPKNQQRRKIWDISPNLHCSIIGTCLTAAELRQERDAVDAVLNVESANQVPSSTPARSLLYVGGRRGLFDRLRELAEQRGYELFIHDGGVEDNMSLLLGLVSQASAALFAVDCISHSAAGLVKRLCQDEQKKFAPLRTASLASFIAAVSTGRGFVGV